MTELRRAPRMVGAFNTILKPMIAAGVPVGPNGLLTVPGRKSGEPRTTALAIIEDDGRRWVWSPWGETNWVRNLRAAGEATVTVHGIEHAVRARELSPDERLAFFERTLLPVARRMRGGVRFLRMLDGVDVTDPVTASRDRVVFELEPTA
jgi:deazaflavin-dependent oxidoreductase (nitroreductase family)